MKKVWLGGCLFLLIGVLGLAGCSSSGSSSSGSSGSGGGSSTNSEFVGAWAVTGSATAWLYIDSNNTFVWADVPDKTHPHFSGTWSVNNGTFDGAFTNPGVGTGDLIIKISNGVMTIDFVEHWHTPDNHVPYTATKLNAKLPIK